MSKKIRSLFFLLILFCFCSKVISQSQNILPNSSQTAPSIEVPSVSQSTPPDENRVSEFLGSWVGLIFIDNSTNSMMIKIDISIDGNTIKCAQSLRSDDGTAWNPVTPIDDTHIVYHASFLRDNLTFYWENIGGIWSETQIFSISFISKGQVQVVWVRHVDNVKGDQGQPWDLTGKGVLNRQ